jgi:ESF2/ABP1 family protein
MCAAYQNAVREQKLANEISAAKRERDFYMSRVDRAKAENAKEQRRRVNFLAFQYRRSLY